MALYPIKLGIARPKPSKMGAGKSAGGKGPSPGPDGKIPADLKQKIFKRDDFTCRCCGFRSEKYQEIHHRDLNKKNLAEKNLITTCIFCHQCFNLETVGDMRSGLLIWMPEIEQHQLHNMARAIYIARISQSPVAEAARKTLDLFMERRDEVERRVGTSDPYILATVMKDYIGYKNYHMRDKKLAGVRLFPLDRRIIKEIEVEFNQFPQILAYWRSKDGPFGGKMPQKWVDTYQEIMAAA